MTSLGIRELFILGRSTNSYDLIFLDTGNTEASFGILKDQVIVVNDLEVCKDT